MQQEERLYHPRDTVHLWQRAPKNDVDNSWYKIHYFQQKSLKKESKSRLHPVSPVKSTQVSQEVFNQFLEMQLTCFAECAQTHYVKIYQGESVNLVLPGLGGGHVREISITLHQVYGVPYLSGSSLKGVVRNWALQAFFAGDEKRGMEETDEPTNTSSYFRNPERRGVFNFMMPSSWGR